MATQPKIKILDLRPTQFVLGMKEITFKVDKIAGFNDKELKKYCNDNAIPVIIGPKKEHYMIDHHHFARSCWEMKIEIYKIKKY